MHKILISFTLALTSALLLAAKPASVVVSASGEASGGTTATIEEVKKIALADAKRMALEKAGTQVRSMTQVDNFQLTKDQIQTFAQGLVKVLEVEKESCVYEDKVKAFSCQVTIKAEVSSESQAFLEKVKKSVDREKSNAKAISFGFNIVAWKPESDKLGGVYIKPDSSQTYTNTPLKNGDVLYSGQEYQIHFTPRQDFYVYGINVDSHGQVFPLIPNAMGMSDNFLKAGKTYILPAPGKYYVLDQNTGIEKIYFMASYSRMQDVEYLIYQSGAKNAAKLFESITHARGMNGITLGAPKDYQVAEGVSVNDIEKLVQGKGSAVQSFEFVHK